MRILILKGFFLCFLVSCNNSTPTTSVTPPAVKVVTLQQQNIDIEKDFVGQVYGYKDIPIRTRVEGYLENIYFQEGSYVEKGKLLYLVDPNPLKEAVAAAQSELARSEINRDRAISDLNRIEPLAEINAVSKRDLDAAVAEKMGSEEIVEAAKAQLRLAQINLGYASITAPVDGVIGKSLAQTGEFVGRSPNPVILTTVSTVDSLRVEFFITENDYLAWINQQKAGEEKINNELQLILSDGSVFPYKGKVKFVNREVDAVTGTILIQAIFPNPERLIRPGQFARVRAVVKTVPNALLVPQRAVVEVQGTFSVMRVDDSGKIEQVMIQLGQPYKDYFVVQEGLSPNDKVVFEGLQRAKNGGMVTPEVIEFKSQL